MEVIGIPVQGRDHYVFFAAEPTTKTGAIVRTFILHGEEAKRCADHTNAVPFDLEVKRAIQRKVFFHVVHRIIQLVPMVSNGIKRLR